MQPKFRLSEVREIIIGQEMQDSLVDDVKT